MKIRNMEIDEFLNEVKKFHGHLAPGMVCGGFMVELGLRNLPKNGLYDAISETSACIPDAVQILTPCTIGNGWLKITDTGRFALLFYDKYTGKGVRISLDPEKLEKWPETHIWAMKLKPKKEQNKDRLFSEIIEAGFDLYKTQKISVDINAFPKKGKIFICQSCGESYRGTNNGLCKSCQNLVPFTIDNHDEKELNSVPVETANGKKALHDMTRIIPGISKEPKFRKGHEFCQQDINSLKSMGKEHIFVEELNSHAKDLIHENNAAVSFAEKIAGNNVYCDLTPYEGKIDFKSSDNGILMVNSGRLTDFNRCRNVMCAVMKNFTPVKKDEILGGTRAVPLYLDKNEFDSAMDCLKHGPLISVAPFRLKKMGIIVTGTEVFNGKVKDRFTAVIENHAHKYNLEITHRIICPDNKKNISDAVGNLMEKQTELIVITGGMSVDPDDITRNALIESGLVDEIYGTPFLPGAMTLTGRIKKTRVIGVPAGAVFYDKTAFDILLPILLADIPLTRRDIALMAEGGYLNSSKRIFSD